MMPQNTHFANQGNVRYTIKACRLLVPQAYTQWSGVSIRQEKKQEGVWVNSGNPIPIKVSFTLGDSNYLVFPLKLKGKGCFKVFTEQLVSPLSTCILSMRVHYQFGGKNYELLVD